MNKTIALALTTEANQALAEQLAVSVLEQRLAACVSLKPVVSMYHWQGALERSEEVQLLIKTHPDRLAALQSMVMEHHSYSTPQWLCWSASGSDAYAAWLAESCLLS
jgi:periplasmic divalent cation tolerance protein